MVRLPNSKNVVISRIKLTEYLLSKTHPVGSSKAKFFRNLGFDNSNLDKLNDFLVRIAQTNVIKESKKMSYGVNYVIDGTIKSPSGKSAKIRTVWFMESGKSSPRFVTAYPL